MTEKIELRLNGYGTYTLTVQRSSIQSNGVLVLLMLNGKREYYSPDAWYWVKEVDETPEEESGVIVDNGPKDINECVRAWHNSDSAMPIFEWLGMTEEQYGAWLKKGLTKYELADLGYFESE